MVLHRVAAIVILLASFPLMVFATECGFGLGATLMVPTCCLGYWFALTSPQRSHRLGWFAFSSVNVFLLPFCPWWKRIIEAGLHAFQLLVRDVQPSSLYHNAEIVALFLIIILPWGFGCGLGRFVAKLTRRFASESPTHTVSERSIFFQFSVRDMLLTIMVFAFLTGWLSTTVQKWREHEKANQQLLLRQFQDSFTSGNVTLPPETLTAPENCVVRWDIVINPAYVGKSLEYEFQTRLNNIYRAKQISGKVTLTQKGYEQTDTR